MAASSAPTSHPALWIGSGRERHRGVHGRPGHRGRARVRRARRGRRCAGRDRDGLEERHAADGEGGSGARGARDPARDARDERAPGPGHRGRVREERADARPARDHRGRRARRGAPRRGRGAHGPARDRCAADIQDLGERRARRAARDRSDAARGAGRDGWGGQPQERGRARGAHPVGVIERYTRPEMGAVWSERRKLETWLQVELAVVDVLGEQGVVPEEDAAAIRDRASFTVDAVKEREQVTDHDVAAFVDVVAGSVGEAGRWIHHGLTSSDVLDTALGLQLSQAGMILVGGAADYRNALARRAREHVDTLCVGRTHGVHAEPTTFGVKLAGFAFEAHRNLLRLERAVEGVSVGALSGAVGTYAANGPEVEEAVLRRLGLAREYVSTQVVPRDRHAELLEAIALAGAGLERFATEVRHLQRTEVREVEEPFRSGAQKGSSAMPHKRNPIVSERITGIARLLRGYAQAGLENVALWHERDISHSSVERVTLPDATILLDYAQHLAIRVVDGMTVHADRMRENLNATHGALFSQRALLALVEAGRSRDDAYRIVQEAAQRAWDERIEFRELMAEAAPELDLDRVFDPEAFVRHASAIVGRLDRIA